MTKSKMSKQLQVLGKRKRAAPVAPPKRKRQRKAVGFSPLQALIISPATADLRRVRVSGEESGYITRFKSHESSGLFHTLPPTTNFSGYVAWFPGYHNQPGINVSGRGMSLFGWWNDSASVSPTNGTSSDAYGGLNASSTRSVYDPVNSFLTGTTAQAARTLAACLTMRYLGRLDATAGEYCVLTGINSDVLVGGLASVNDLFTLAENSHRLTTKTVEVRYTPTNLGCRYRTEGISATNNSDDRCILSGTTTSQAVQGSSTSLQKAIVIAFRGVQQDSSPKQNVLQFGLSKTVEWLPQSGSGLSQPTSDGGGESPDAATAALDRKVPSWRTIQTADRPVDAVIQAAYTGAMHTTDFDLDIPAFGHLHLG